MMCEFCLFKVCGPYLSKEMKHAFRWVESSAVNIPKTLVWMASISCKQQHPESTDSIQQTMVKEEAECQTYTQTSSKHISAVVFAANKLKDSSNLRHISFFFLFIN